ncbi:MAG: oligopeptide/dipeptide ABC transporter ATP-binding protein [Rhodospirillales bacterium]
MYLGQVVEWNTADELSRNPKHPYTQKLLNSVPNLQGDGGERDLIAGEVPSPLAPPPGCHFHPRCPNARCVPGKLCRRRLRQPDCP